MSCSDLRGLRPVADARRVDARLARFLVSAQRARGYDQFLEAIADPRQERHKELLEWSGGDLEPQQFDIDEINRRLASLAPHKAHAARPQSGPPAEPARGPHRTHTMRCIRGVLVKTKSLEEGRP
jgi:hypothetical protein